MIKSKRDIGRYYRAAKAKLLEPQSIKLLKSLSIYETVADVRKAKITYLQYHKFAKIAQAISNIKAQNLSGLYIEAGCALGGSTVVISKLKPDTNPFNVYDVFDMIPEPTGEDTQDVIDRYKTISAGESTGIKGDTYYGYMDNLYQVVEENLKTFGVDKEAEKVSLIKGLLQDTMEIQDDVVFAHIDVDWYEPVKVSLDRINQHLVVGGIIVLDDYFDWGGCRKAVDQFLSDNQGRFHIDKSLGGVSLTRL